MREQIKEPIYLIGLPLSSKTSNDNGQSSIDCKNLWHAFEDGNYQSLITRQLSNHIYGVYYDYDGDSTQPFSYLVGCRVDNNTPVPQGLTSITIPPGNYEKINAKGTMPDCVIKAWKDIWAGNFARTHQIDFEVYDERSRDWANAEVDVYISVK